MIAYLLVYLSVCLSIFPLSIRVYLYVCQLLSSRTYEHGVWIHRSNDCPETLTHLWYIYWHTWHTYDISIDTLDTHMIYVCICEISTWTTDWWRHWLRVSLVWWRHCGINIQGVHKVWIHGRFHQWQCRQIYMYFHRVHLNWSKAHPLISCNYALGVRFAQLQAVDCHTEHWHVTFTQSSVTSYN